MKFLSLKKTRVTIAILFFSLTLMVFLDIKEWLPVETVQNVLYLQFLPSLLKFTKIAGIATAGFIFIILLTALFGRIYCSAICPLGIMFDITSKLTNRTKKKQRRFKFTKPYTKLRYSILVLSAVSLISGTVILIDILDPFSNFGKISTVLFRPALILSNNVVANVMEFFGSYAVQPFLFKNIDPILFALVLAFFITVVILAVKKGRLFCNTVCPVGTILGLLAKYSLIKIRIDEDACVQCGVCGKTCKSDCIDVENKKVDYSRCVTCFNCIPACKQGGIRFESIFKKSKPQTEKEPQLIPLWHPADMFRQGSEAKLKNQINSDIVKEEESVPAVTSNSRRRFLTSMGLLTTAVVKKAYSDKVVKVITPSKIPVVRNYPITPPGSKSISNFTDVCVSCYMCVSACPSQVIQPSLFEYGLDGVLMPHLNNKAGYCNYNCNKCSDVCPAGAILPVPLEEKQTVQIGVAKFIRDNCVVILDKTECGACSEHCPTKAVSMVKEKGLMVPVIDEKLCVGCGACEYACPAKPHKSIYVNGNDIHQLAERPKQEKLKEVDMEEDFPF